jgi:putative addiction module component (TIGR02574 family)
MAHPLKALEQEVMALPVEERARLAHELISSLDSGVEEDVEGYWSQEIHQRLNQIDEGVVKLSPAEETFNRARDALTK